MFGLIPRKKAERELAWREGNPFGLMRRGFAPLFNRIFGMWPFLEVPFEEAPFWGFNVEESANDVVIRAEVPGFEAGDLSVMVAGDTLTILAEHKKEVKDEKKGEESFLGRMERTVPLPPAADVEKIEARYRNGVLEVRVPKKPGPVPRKVEVKT